MMRRRCSRFFFGIACAFFVAFFAGTVVAESVPDGEEVMARLRSALPTVPLQLEASLQVRDHNGRIMRSHPLEVTLDWGARVPSARYVVRDGFGTERERITIQWPEGEAARFAYAQGDPPEPQALDSVDQSILGLNVTWSDVSLSFLWWPGAQNVGTEKVLGRVAYVLDIPAPEDQSGRMRGIRLWVDTKVYLLLRADVYDAKKRLVRRLQVKSLRKLDDMYMVQNLDIHDYSLRERLTLQVQTLQELAISPLREAEVSEATSN